jgi:hypothetical protein
VVEPAGFYATGGTDPQGRPANEVDEIDFYQAGHQTFSGGGTVTPSYKGGFSIDDPSGCCGNSNATDTGLEGGTITAPQLATGTINHALAISADCMNGYVVAPAPTAIQGFYPTSGGDCAGSPPGDGPPDGARLQYKLSDSQIDALPVDALEKMYLKAAAHYGVIVTDTGGAPADPKFEPIVTYSPFESKNAQGQYPQSMMTWIENHIPGSTDPFTETMTWNWSDWQVVSPCYSTTPPSC